MRPRSALLLPPRPLSSCVFAAILRDTRGADLSDAQRFNHFPASPLVSVTLVISGDLRLLPPGAANQGLPDLPTLPRLHVLPPQPRPTTSWSTGPVAALSLGIYADAWVKLETAGLGTAMGGALEDAFASWPPGADPAPHWTRVCGTLAPLWDEARHAGPCPDWPGSDRLADWAHSAMARAALSGPGQSLRAMQRRLRRWTGQSRRALDFYAAFENLHQLSMQAGDTPLAALALDAGFADQSHMGRAVRRATGFSPAQLNERINSGDEAFWCYRLLGERF